MAAGTTKLSRNPFSDGCSHWYLASVVILKYMYIMRKKMGIEYLYRYNGFNKPNVDLS